MLLLWQLKPLKVSYFCGCCSLLQGDLLLWLLQPSWSKVTYFCGCCSLPQLRWPTFVVAAAFLKWPTSVAAAAFFKVTYFCGCCNLPQVGCPTFVAAAAFKVTYFCSSCSLPQGDLLCGCCIFQGDLLSRLLQPSSKRWPTYVAAVPLLQRIKSGIIQFVVCF